MADPIAAVASKIQLQPLPDFPFADQFIFSAEVIASVLAIIVGISFYRFYRLTGFIYLLGLAIGFFFITSAEILLAVDVWMEIFPEYFNMLFWLRLLTLSYGFSFLAVSYYYKHREDDKSFMFRVAALSAIPIMVTIVALIITSPAFDFPPYNIVDEYFRVFNLVMLTYVFRSTLSSIVEQGRKEFVYIPAAFAVLWLGQFSALIVSIDASVSAAIAQHTAKVVGLALFTGVMVQILRGKKLPRKELE